MKTIDKINWACAVAVVSLTTFVTGKVDLIAFLWLPTFLTCVYGLPLWFDSCIGRHQFKLEQLRRDWRCRYGR